MSTLNSNARQGVDQSEPCSEQQFYTAPELSQHLDLIQHLVSNSDLVPLVRGAVGAGKSTAICQLQAQASESWFCCRLDATPMLHPDQLMIRLARFFALSDADDNIRDRLIACFESLRDEGRLAVIIIDDAEQLPPASLIALLRLHELHLGNAPIVALVLFALPSIDHTLATPQLQVMNLQLFHILDMPLLVREQVPGYLRLLLEQEELTEQISLAEPKIDTLFRMSGGLPGRLTPLILQSINESVPLNRAHKKWHSIRKVLALVGAGLAVVLMLLFQDEINRLFEPKMIDQQLMPLPGQAPITKMDSMPSIRSRQGPSKSVELSVAGPSQIGGQSDLVDEAADVELELPKDAVLAVNSEASLEHASQQNNASPEVLVLTPTEVTPTEVTPTEVTPTEVTPTEVTPTEVTPTEVTPTKVTPEISVSQKVEVLAAPKQGVLSGAKWAKQQASSNFTIQLIGVSEPESIDQFIRRHGLEGKVFSIAMARKGRPWYVLLFGSYANKELAKVAISRDLPLSLRKRGVWPRSFDSLQQDIK
ncbi:MAG: AAA family ATPase [Candidatus Polarisedimenticolaceae bacterium]|nr:AAA family ATPase [Candidatus Polarisedimenticolaceae bacterium]